MTPAAIHLLVICYFKFGLNLIFVCHGIQYYCAASHLIGYMCKDATSTLYVSGRHDCKIKFRSGWKTECVATFELHLRSLTSRIYCHPVL